MRMLGAGGMAAVAGAGLSRGARAAESDPLPPVVLDWFGAWTTDDPAANVAALYAPEGSYEDVAFGASVLGPDIEGYLREALVGMSMINRYPRTTFAIDGLAVAEQLYWANTTLFSPEGGEFQVYAVTIFEYSGDRLYRTTDYYDFSSIMNQLDLVPEIPYGDCKSG
jgi:hypothetical protein